MKPEFYDMDGLLVKYLLGEATAGECRAVEEWLAASKTNQARYEQFKAIWEAGRQIGASSKVDEDAAWLRLKNRLQQPSKPVIVKKLLPSGWWRVAALFILVAGAIGLTYYWGRNEEVRDIAIQTTGQVLSDTLPDGSVATLNKNSILTYPEKFKGESRTIALQGEAFFNVRLDQSKPFIIKVNEVTVRVVGTSFNVRSLGGTTEVTVETGVVQVIRGNKAIVLHPRESTVVKTDDSLLVKQPVQDRLYNYYRTREFVCDNTPLWKLVRALNEAYNSNIIIERTEIRSLPLTTTFRNESLETILNIISQTLGVKVVKKEDAIILE